MKKILFLLLAVLLSGGALLSAQGRHHYTEASALTLTGKLFPDTPNPYHRVDTVVHKGFTPTANRLVTSLSLSFTTTLLILFA